jgi:hypothetical protein
MAVVGEPLTPAVLEKIGVLGDWPPPTDAAFDPGGKWAATFRIWTCHGYTDRGNTNRGTLRIERMPQAGAKGAFALRVVERVVHAGDIVHERRAQATCLADELASPQQWTVASRFVGPDGIERSDLAAQRGCACKDGRVACAIDGRVEQRSTSGRLTADWCLFEAVQRLPFSPHETAMFDVLEGLTIRRPSQQLFYGGEDTLARNGSSLRLHRFYQLGRAMLPYEYWLDGGHRLLLVVSHDKAFLLDPAAERKVRWRRKRAAKKEQ